jgi:hypothetical protein
MERLPEYHVLTREGDATGEVESVVRDLGSPESAGLHRCFFVSRARQTVVMVRGLDSPLAVRLRAMGWSEPAAQDTPRAHPS